MTDTTELSPCPFCKAGETRIDEQTYWTGMRSQILSVSVKHWCPKSPLTSFIEMKAKTKEEAVALWNTRAALTEAAELKAQLLEALKYAHSQMQPFCDDTIVKQAIARAEQKGQSHD